MSASSKMYDLFGQHLKLIGAALVAGVLAGCSGTAADSGSTTPPVTGPVVAKISVLTVSDVASNAPKTSVNSDNSDTVTIVATALDSSNVAVPSATLAFSSEGGELQVQSATTDTSGKAVATFRAGSGLTNKANRTETITIKAANGVSVLAPISVIGTTLTSTLAQGSSSSIVSGATADINLLLKDSGGAVIAGQSVSLSNSGSGSVTLASQEVTTDSNGKATVRVTGASSGAVSVAATALGAAASIDLNVTSSASAFGFVSPANNSLVGVNVGQVITVNAPSATQVVFATSQGVWGNSAAVYTATVTGGVATATLTSSRAGVATIDAYNPANTAQRASLALSVGATDASNGSVTLQASPATVAVSNSSSKNSTTLIAQVKAANGDPVYNAPVLFSITVPSGSGESVGPSVVFSDSSGFAQTTFVSGSASGQVTVGATVIGATPITAGSTTVDVGGQAVSVGLGVDTALRTVDGDSNYYLAMSVFVTDPQGNPINGKTVNLSVQPIYFSRGDRCGVEGVTLSGVVYPISYITENSAESDYFGALGLTTSQNGGLWKAVLGPTFARSAIYDISDSKPSSIQPSAANAGSVPQSVTTGSDGKATFTYVYPKSSALWHVVRVRARTTVNGTEAINDKVFRLAAVAGDLTPTCKIEDSPYN